MGPLGDENVEGKWHSCLNHTCRTSTPMKIPYDFIGAVSRQKYSVKNTLRVTRVSYHVKAPNAKCYSGSHTHLTPRRIPLPPFSVTQRPWSRSPGPPSPSLSPLPTGAEVWAYPQLCCPYLPARHPPPPLGPPECLLARRRCSQSRCRTPTRRFDFQQQQPHSCRSSSNRCARMDDSL